jgi:hypothetical protein
MPSRDGLRESSAVRAAVLRWGRAISCSPLSNQTETRPPGGIQVFPGVSPSFGPPWFGGPAQSPPQERNGVRRNAPGDAEPRRSADDDNAEKWAANR